MKIVGIIAEFNPFHNGHKRIFEKAYESGAEYIIVVMSGDYMQRGTPAIADKFTRAKYALECGADLVLELPVYYSLGSAEFFAQGGVTILNHLGCVDTLLFGSEAGDVTTITQVAQVLNDEPDDYISELKKAVKEGKSFPAARQSALIKCLPELEGDSLLVSPNNILGIEYVKSLLKSNSSIKTVTISRNDNGYSSESLPESGFYASATSIRSILMENNIQNSQKLLKPFLPEKVLESLLNQSAVSGYAYGNLNAFSELLKYKLNLEKFDGFTDYLDIHEDFSEKIVNHLGDFKSFEDFALSLKSRDITYTRICRSLMHILLNIKKENMQEYVDDGYTTYLRILGLKKQSSALLKLIKENADKELIQSPRKAFPSISPLEKRLLQESMAASSIYDLALCQNPKNEFTKEIVVV